MVAIQFKLLGLIALCTLASSTVIERRGSVDHLETVHKDDLEKRQIPPILGLPAVPQDDLEKRQIPPAPPAVPGVPAIPLAAPGVPAISPAVPGAPAVPGVPAVPGAPAFPVPLAVPGSPTPPMVNASIDSQGASNDPANSSTGSHTFLTHSPRSTADTVMNASPEGFDYHRYFATDNDKGNPKDSLLGAITGNSTTR